MKKIDKIKQVRHWGVIFDTDRGICAPSSGATGIFLAVGLDSPRSQHFEKLPKINLVRHCHEVFIPERETLSASSGVHVFFFQGQFLSNYFFFKDVAQNGVYLSPQSFQILLKTEQVRHWNEMMRIFCFQRRIKRFWRN